MNDNVEYWNKPQADVCKVGRKLCRRIRTRSGSGAAIWRGPKPFWKLLVELHVFGVEVRLKVVVGRHRLDKLANTVAELLRLQ